MSTQVLLVHADDESTRRAAAPNELPPAWSRPDGWLYDESFQRCIDTVG